MDDPLTKKIVNEFASGHVYHIPRGSQYFRAFCPFCEIITREQTDSYPEVLQELFGPIVERSWNYWERSALHIADRVDSQTLLNEIVYHALTRWVQPKYRDISNLDVEEITNHPYVLQKTRSTI